MPARDLFHNAVKTALEKDGWVITDDPLHIRIGGVIDIYIDLGQRNRAMASIENYREFIQNLLAEKAQRGSDKNVEAQTIFDQAQDHYQLIYIGWHNKRNCST